MFKKALLIIGLSFSVNTYADWSARLNHFVIKDDLLLALSESHSVTTLGLGYRYDLNQNLYLSANLIYGLSYDSDPALFSDTNQIELDKLYGSEFRLGYALSRDFAVFTGGRYFKQEYQITEADAPLDHYSRSDSDLLIGMDYQLFQDLRLEITWAKKGSGDALSFGLDYRF